MEGCPPDLCCEGRDTRSIPRRRTTSNSDCIAFRPARPCATLYSSLMAVGLVLT